MDDPGSPPLYQALDLPPIQCCVQDFRGMTFGTNSDAILRDITQQCQLTITELPDDDVVGTPVDTPVDTPVEDLSPGAIVGIIVLVMVLLTGLLLLVSR
jgi:hypothetical protein